MIPDQLRRSYHYLTNFALWNVAKLDLLDCNSLSSSPVEGTCEGCIKSLLHTLLITRTHGRPVRTRPSPANLQVAAQTISARSTRVFHEITDIGIEELVRT